LVALQTPATFVPATDAQELRAYRKVIAIVCISCGATNSRLEQKEPATNAEQQPLQKKEKKKSDSRHTTRPHPLNPFAHGWYGYVELHAWLLAAPSELPQKVRNKSQTIDFCVIDLAVGVGRNLDY